MLSRPWLSLLVVLTTLNTIGMADSGWAHSGRTNASGCHNDNINGGYHCHNSGSTAPSRSGTSGYSPAPTSEADYTRYMRIGYQAFQLGDYQTALINFRRALNERPGNSYATQAIANTEAQIRRNR